MKPIPKKLEQAVQWHRAGELDRAAALYREVLGMQPDHADALHLLGLIELKKGHAAEAHSLFARAIVANSKVPAYHMNHGLALRAMGRTEEAVEAFQQSLRLKPDAAETHLHLGNALKAAGRFQEAVQSLREAVRYAPGAADAWLNLGVAWLQIMHREEAVECFQTALKLQPGRAEAHNILGYALQSQGRVAAAIQSYREALRLKPDHFEALNNLGNALKSQGNAAEAIASYRTALALRHNAQTHSNLVYALNFADGLAPEAIFAEHTRWAELHAAPFQSQWPTHERPLEARRPRLGYVSPDFINHSVAYFFEPVLAAHARADMEVFCYSDAPVPDQTTGRLRALAEHWKDTSLLSDEELTRVIRADGIDILVDLSGHTARNRLLVFARKPAPIQVTWMGYPNTTGLAAMDYRLTDSVSDPEGQTDSWHSEKLVRLPRSFSCYRPSEECPEVNGLPALCLGQVTYGCFNNFAKVTDSLLAMWAQILHATPGSRLFLKSRSLSDEALCQALREKFTRTGIAGERLLLHGQELSVFEHLKLYHQVDVALDTFPYNGTTTTCEALWMGVPVVTLAGRTHVARVGASLLTHLGYPEWIASGPEEYAAKAVALTADRDALAKIRQSLRMRMTSSPLCEAQAFTRELEKDFRQLLEKSGA